MADKFRVSFPIAVNFSEGELPSAAKLSGIAKQAKRGLSQLEYALGDLWNQSGDSVFGPAADANLMIPNVGRYLGASALLSPRIPALPNLQEYTHDFTASAGSYEARLPFPPAGATYSWSSSKEATPETNKGDVDAANEWWIDTTTGEIFAWDGFSVGEQLTYTANVQGDLGDATFNVIPDPDTSVSYNFRGLKIEYVNGTDDAEGYYIYLPPRMPLNARKVEQSPQENATNFQSSPSSGSRRFWQTHTADADTGADAEHYRYVLPTILTDNWGQASTVPAGFVYLWDPTGTKTIIEGVVFSAENAGTPRKWLLIAKGQNLTTWLSSSSAYTTAKLQSSSHAPEMYPNNGLRLITVGSSLSTAFASLMGTFLNHDHSSAGSLVTRRVSHAVLANLFDAGQSPYFDASKWPYDDHPQYLNRYGNKTFDGKYRDRSRGAMYGDLILAAAVADGGTYLHTNSASNKLWFAADDNDGCGLWWDSTLGSAGGLNIQLPFDGETRVLRMRLDGWNTVDWTFNQSASLNTLASSQAFSVTSGGQLSLSAGGNQDIVLNPGGINNSTVLGVTVQGLPGYGPKVYFSDNGVGPFSMEMSNTLGAGGCIFEMVGLTAAPTMALQIPGNLVVKSTTGGKLFLVDGTESMGGGVADPWAIKSDNPLVPTEFVPANNETVVMSNSGGVLSVAAGTGRTAAQKGMGGKVVCNQYEAGAYNDSTYGYSTDEPATLWGRPRKYHAGADEWLVLGPTSTWTGSPALAQTVSTSAISTNGMYQPYLTLGGGSGVETQMAYHTLRLPFAKYAIVDVYIRFIVSGYAVLQGDLFFGIGYQDTFGGSYTQVNEVNVSNVINGGSTFSVGVPYDGTLFNPGNLSVTHIVISDINLSGGASNYAPNLFFRITTAPASRIHLLPVTIIYRIGEY